MDPCDRHLAAAYALAALPATQASSFARHLTRCSECRAEADALLEAASRLALAVPPVDPPPALRTRIVEATRFPGILSEP